VTESSFFSILPVNIATMSHRFALIGCGSIAPRHADQINAAGTLAAVCDILPDRAAAFATKYNAKAYTDLESMMNSEQPGVLVVCTPNGLHAAHSILALQHGWNVLCEKPLAITVHDGKKMLNAAQQSGKSLFVVKQNRYNAPVRAIKELLDNGKLGRIHGFEINCFWNRPDVYYKDPWRGTLALDGGTLFTQFSHFIDLLYWWLGEIREVRGYRSNALHSNIIEFEDNGVASLVMKSGAVGSLHYSINAYNENFEGSMVLFGEKGTVKIGGQYLNRIDHFQVEGMETPLLENSNEPNIYTSYKGSMSNHHVVYQELLKALDDPLHFFPDAAEGLKSVEMIEQIYAASPFAETTEIS
jgi:UDP-N-acetyl-2-amino-2-deoxyglucuronate dehydrogenase